MGELGEVSEIDVTRDVAFIKDTGGDRTSHKNAKPSNHNEYVNIQGTVTEEGFVTVNEQDQPHAIYGYGSCYSDMYLKSWNNTWNSGYKCQDTRYDQMFSTINDDNISENNTQKGDSGALYYVEDPNNPGNWYAMGSHSGKELIGYTVKNYGAQGFTIANIYDRRWDW